MICFSLFRRALSSVVSGFILDFRRESVTGVFGSAVVAVATISFANRLAWSISPIVSPNIIAGNDILFHSPSLKRPPNSKIKIIPQKNTNNQHR
ncbi:hypothetical protein HanRHA438_Chr09g0387301 [Helianthus annuus]|nr:hypothetical protein HanIR_Chr09g0404921 [Helianthus annuus]KAJ0887138.1 hypothetical protein HanRHA438_Chr09g0387301 [Helianthus annuus]